MVSTWSVPQSLMCAEVVLSVLLGEGQKNQVTGWGVIYKDVRSHPALPSLFDSWLSRLSGFPPCQAIPLCHFGF